MAIRPSNPSAGHTHRGNQNWKRHVYPNVHRSIVYNNQDMLQPRCPSADEWIRKLWYVYTVEYYSTIKKNTFESVLVRWMDLEPIIQSEVRQKEKQYTNAYIWNLERWWWWPCMRDSKRDTDVLNSHLDSVGEGKDGMIWENGIETCKLSYVKWIASPGSMHDTGCLRLMNRWPRGMLWGGRWKGVSGWEHVYTHGRFMLMYGKMNTIL